MQRTHHHPLIITFIIVITYCIIAAAGPLTPANFSSPSSSQQQQQQQRRLLDCFTSLDKLFAKSGKKLTAWQKQHHNEVCKKAHQKKPAPSRLRPKPAARRPRPAPAPAPITANTVLLVSTNPGEGDTLDNCNADCSKDPEPETKYACDVTTFQCVNATSGSDNATCDASCADETPSALVGLWRGLNVQTGFTMGEILMNFTSSGVTYGAYPLGGGAFPAREATVASVGPSLLRLTFTAPEELVGIVKVVSYSNPGWPTGPVSRGAR